MMRVKTTKKSRVALMKEMIALAGLLACAALVSILSMVSLEAGVLAGIVIALACFTFPYFSRGSVESAPEKSASDYEPSGVAKALSSLQERQNLMSERLQEQADDISDIKKSLGQIRSENEALKAAQTSQAATVTARPGVVVHSATVTRPALPSTRPMPAGVRFSQSAASQVPKTLTGGAPATANLSANDGEMTDLVIRELLHSAVQSSKIEAFMQPIVSLPQRQTRYYEVFARVRAKPGLYLSAARYMNIAKQEALIAKIDNALLLHSLFLIKKNKDKPGPNGFFLNIAPSILKNKAFMGDLLTFLSKNRSLAPLLVFEIQQKDFDRVSVAEHKILEGLSKLGCRFSLDHVVELPDNAAHLQDLNVRFVKVHAADFLSELRNERRFEAMARRKKKLEDSGIDLIVEKVETEDDMRDLLDYNIRLGQGYLFGKPGIHGRYRVQDAA